MAPRHLSIWVQPRTTALVLAAIPLTGRSGTSIPAYCTLAVPRCLMAPFVDHPLLFRDPRSAVAQIGFNSAEPTSLIGRIEPIADPGRR